MEIIISIKTDSGEVIALHRILGDWKEGDIIGGIESEVSKVREEMLPELSSKLVEHHQLMFNGEKNKEEEWE